MLKKWISLIALMMCLAVSIPAVAVVSDQTSVNSYTGNGVATSYAYTFRIFQASDLVVTVDGVTKTLTTDYTVAGAGQAGGGSVSFVSPPASNAAVVIYRNLPYDRSTDYAEGGDLTASTLNADLDKGVMQVQQLRRDMGRAIKMPMDVTIDQTLFGDVASRIGKTISFDALGNAILAPVVNIGGTLIGNGLTLSGSTLSASGVVACQNNSGDAVLIQTAVNAAGGAGGGLIRINAGTCAINATINIPFSNVFIAGAGSGGNHDYGINPASPADSATIWNWTGANGGTFIHIYSPEGITNQKMMGGGVKGIYFNASDPVNNGYAYGIQITSRGHGRFEDLFFREPQAFGLLLDQATLLGDYRSTMNCLFVNVYSRNYAAANGGLMWLKGDIANPPGGVCQGCDALADPNVNTFINVGAMNFRDGIAFRLGNSDHNYFYNARATMSGGAAGIGISFEGSNVSSSLTARKNAFYNWTGGHVIKAGGTESGYSYASSDNVFIGMDDSNDTPDPAIDTNASVWVLSKTDGSSFGFANVKGAFAPAQMYAKKARGRLTSETIRAEGRADQIRVARQSADGNSIEGEWAITSDVTTNNLKVSRVTGSGSLELPNSVVMTGMHSRVTTQLDKTDANLSPVTGLLSQLEAGKTYQFRAVLFVAADATGGHRYAITGTSTATQIIYHIHSLCNTGGTNVIYAEKTALGGAAGQASCVTVKTVIDGLITVNQAGNIYPQFSQNTASGTSSVKVGSYFMVNEIK